MSYIFSVPALDNKMMMVVVVVIMCMLGMIGVCCSQAAYSASTDGHCRWRNGC